MNECQDHRYRVQGEITDAGCPYCEIDRLKEELKVVRFDNNILRDQRSAEAQVEHKRYEEWRDTLPADTAMPVASWHILKSAWMKSFLPAIKRAEDLERQLAEWYKVFGHLSKDADTAGNMINEGIADNAENARKQAAREALEWMIQNYCINERMANDFCTKFKL